jgi:hypothetical protein
MTPKAKTATTTVTPVVDVETKVKVYQSLVVEQTDKTLSLAKEEAEKGNVVLAKKLLQVVDFPLLREMDDLVGGQGITTQQQRELFQDISKLLQNKK